MLEQSSTAFSLKSVSKAGFLGRVDRNSIPRTPVLPPGIYPSVKMKLGTVDSSEYHDLLLNLYCKKRSQIAIQHLQHIRQLIKME